MSIVKNALKELQEEKIELFIHLVMRIGGKNDLYKRIQETKTAYKYLKFDNKESGLVNHLKKELKTLRKALYNEFDEIEFLRKRQYILTKHKKPTRLRMYYWTERTFYLSEEETQKIKDYISANYHERKPFPYPHEITEYRNNTYGI